MPLARGHNVEVAGEASYQPALSAVCGGKSPEGSHLSVTAVLVPEPTNPFDPNAVRVEVERQVVGYLKRAEAERYAPVLGRLWSEGQRLGYCRAVIVGGWDRGGGDEGHFGIWLDLAPPEKISP